MDLLEYQAKSLFREMAIPILPSQRIDEPKDLKQLTIPYPVVLKSQVRAGGRGKAGGIRFAENTIDAVAAAQAIFHLPIMDEYPEVILAEAKYDADQELYLAVVLDAVTRRPVLLGSQQGGVNVDATWEQMQRVVVDQEFSPFYARRLALKMGLQGQLIQSVSGIIEKMYRLFVQKDLDLVEINPLGISRSGQVMALDGKVSANNAAIGRHTDLAVLFGEKKKPLSESSDPNQKYPQCAIYNANTPQIVEMGGNIGILCNGAGLTMATLDLICDAGGRPANFVNIGGEDYSEGPGALRDRLENGLDLVAQTPNIHAVLVNIVSSISKSEQIAGAVASYLQRRSRTRRDVIGKDAPLQFVVRLASGDLTPAQAILADFPVTLVQSWDDAVNQIISLANANPTSGSSRKD